MSQPSLSDLQTEDQANTKPDHSPSVSESDPASSLGHTDSVFIPDTLPRVQIDHEYQGSLDDDDSMSEGSSGTAVMVGHPCSDEEDTAERRWRRAEQRGNDIRRASAPPCPRAVGTEGYLKVIVVSVPFNNAFLCCIIDPLFQPSHALHLQPQYSRICSGCRVFMLLHCNLESLLTNKAVT